MFYDCFPHIKILPKSIFNEILNKVEFRILEDVHSSDCRNNKQTTRIIITLSTTIGRLYIRFVFYSFVSNTHELWLLKLYLMTLYFSFVFLRYQFLVILYYLTVCSHTEFITWLTFLFLLPVSIITRFIIFPSSLLFLR